MLPMMMTMMMMTMKIVNLTSLDCLFRGKQSLETICLLLAYKIKV